MTYIVIACQLFPYLLVHICPACPMDWSRLRLKPGHQTRRDSLAARVHRKHGEFGVSIRGRRDDDGIEPFMLKHILRGGVSPTLADIS